MEKLLSVKQVAELLNIKPSTIYEWTHTKYIPHYKVGRLVLFRWSEIENWLKKLRVPGRTRRIPNINLD